MKKNYMDPELTVVQFETEEVMSNIVSGGIPGTDSDVDDGDF